MCSSDLEQSVTERRGVAAGPDHDDRLRVDQPRHRFGLGAVLARLEARVFLEEAVARFATIAPAGPVERLASGVIAGTLAAPLRLGA